ncbi:MAG: hypothetical protein JXP73_03750 [Deltaproteobacteria bacterium]|nr:hypothetical protein [Deltaproteobacteria bacterium]
MAESGFNDRYDAKPRCAFCQNTAVPVTASGMTAWLVCRADGLGGTRRVTA